MRLPPRAPACGTRKPLEISRLTLSSLATDKLHVHFGAGRLGFGLVLPALENASSPYVILNRPSAVWTPVIDREKETQQHVGVKVRALSNASRFLP